MNAVAQKASTVLRNQSTQDDILENIFKKALELDTERHKDNPGYMAWATSAVPVCMGLANILLAVKYPDSGRGFRAITDLTYELGANDFWTKNAAVLVPILTVALNSHRDYLGMRVEEEKYSEYAMYDKLIAGAQSMPLEIFSMVLYLVGGPLLLATGSLPLKIALAPHFTR